MANSLSQHQRLPDKTSGKLESAIDKTDIAIGNVIQLLGAG